MKLVTTQDAPTPSANTRQLVESYVRISERRCPEFAGGAIGVSEAVLGLCAGISSAGSPEATVIAVIDFLNALVAELAPTVDESIVGGPPWYTVVAEEMLT